jgi:hypothetical protein
MFALRPYNLDRLSSKENTSSYYHQFCFLKTKVKTKKEMIFKQKIALKKLNRTGESGNL